MRGSAANVDAFQLLLLHRTDVLIMRRFLIPLLLWRLPAGSVVIDRIAVIVDKHVIKASDIGRDVRVTEFLNREPLNMNADVKKKAAERLIDQTVIREEVEKGGYALSGRSEEHTSE